MLKDRLPDAQSHGRCLWQVLESARPPRKVISLFSDDGAGIMTVMDAKEAVSELSSSRGFSAVRRNTQGAVVRLAEIDCSWQIVTWWNADDAG